MRGRAVSLAMARLAAVAGEKADKSNNPECAVLGRATMMQVRIDGGMG